jgi:hypothetical protein
MCAQLWRCNREVGPVTDRNGWHGRFLEDFEVKPDPVCERVREVR